MTDHNNPSRVRSFVKAAVGPERIARVRELGRTLKTNREARKSLRFQTGSHRLEALRNSRAGERCIILGNGPSLRNTPWSLIRQSGHAVFGLNRIYLNYDKMGFEPDFVACVNKHVLEQFASEFESLRSERFFSWKGGEFIFDPAINWFTSVPRRRFSYDIPRRGLWEGGTVTFAAMQLAFHLGFRDLVLVGIDHRFKDQGPANKLVVSGGEDENHFHPQYFGKGVRWQLPDLRMSERAYTMAKDAYSAHGGRIVDATDGGELRVFERRELDDALAAPIAEGEPRG